MATEHLGDVLAEARIARMTDRRFDDRRVDAHLSTARDASCSGQLHDALEEGPQAVALEQLPQTHHRLGVRHLAAVDPAEVPVHEVAGDLPLELLVAPVLEVLEHQHPQRNLRRGAVPATPATLSEASPHRFEDTVDQRLVVEQLVDATKYRIHEFLRVRSPEQNRVPQASLAISAPNHRRSLITTELCSSMKSEQSAPAPATSPRQKGRLWAHFCTAV